MALTPINNPGRVQKRDALDRITQVLQLAQAGMAIPAKYQEYRGNAADADMKKREAESADRFASGELDQLAIAKNKLVEAPTYKKPGLTPNYPGAPLKLTPPEPTLTPIPGARKYKDAGTGDEKYYVTEDQKKEWQKGADDLRQEYQKQSPVTVLESAQQNFRNAMSSFSKGDKEADLIGLMNIMKLYNPNVSRAADGSVLQTGDSYIDELAKLYNKVLGTNNTVLLAQERAKYPGLAEQAILNYQQNLQKTNQQYRDMAEKRGYGADDIGIRDYAELTPAEGEAPAPEAASPAFAPDVLAYAKKHKISPQQAQAFKDSAEKRAR